MQSILALQNKMDLTALDESSKGSVTPSAFVLKTDANSKSNSQYYAQIIVLYIIILTSILNLSLANGDSALWISLLSSAIGKCLHDRLTYIVPFAHALLSLYIYIHARVTSVHIWARMFY